MHSTSVHQNGMGPAKPSGQPNGTGDAWLHPDPSNLTYEASDMNDLKPSGDSDDSLQLLATEPASNTTLEHVAHFAGALLTEMPLDLGCLEPGDLFHEPSCELPDDETLVPKPSSHSNAALRKEVNMLLDGYQELDFESLDAGLRHKIRRLLRRVLQQQRKPKRIKLRDKIMFVVGTCDLWASAFWLGKSPQTFPSLYIWKAVVLFAIRWIDWKRKKLHYYLFDWCYASNLGLIVALQLSPLNIKVLKMCWAYSLGPLAWSILTFRNSLVYHSVEKITTLFLHLYPACVVWAIRWYPGGQLENELQQNPAFLEAWHAASITDFVLIPILPYATWAILYYTRIFIVSSHRIRERGYDTLFKYITSRPSFYANIIKRAPEAFQPLVYMLFHLLMTGLSMALCRLWWNNYWLSSAFIIGMFIVAAFNGSSYYFEVFARNYISNLGLANSKTAMKSE